MKPFLVLAGIVIIPSLNAQSLTEVLSHQIEAFNSHDIELMSENLTEDFIWSSVMKDSTVVETKGIEAFKEAMTDYFSNVKDVHSEIVESVSDGKIISFKERVSWSSEKGKKWQSSIGVFMIEGGKISRAWYIYEE